MSITNKITQRIPALRKENFVRADLGTKHLVYLSDKYVIRLRDTDQEILKREAELLAGLNHPLIPPVIYQGKMGDDFFMVEKRLRGITLDSVWKNLAKPHQTRIVSQFIEFLVFLRSQKYDKIYSVRNGRYYENFYDYLVDGVRKKMDLIGKNPQAKKILTKLKTIVLDKQARDLFKASPINLVHGDLIFHNLLTDKKNLTGVLDWELALWGDADYDIFRLQNFQRSAKLYLDQGIDESFEYDYLVCLLKAIKVSQLAKFDDRFDKKYQLVQAFYYLNALDWAVSSKNPDKNVREVVEELGLDM